MVILKKIKSSTLIETLVASVIIVIIFVVSSLILNNVFLSVTKNNATPIHTYLKELHYLKINNKISLPFSTEFKEWSIDIFVDNTNLIIEATHKKNKTIIKTYVNQ